MTQKCPAEEIGNNYFSRRSHILMSLLSCPLPTLTSYWSGGFHISMLGLGIGQIVFCFGSIECFYSDTSRWPSDNCNFLCVILFGGKFLVCLQLFQKYTYYKSPDLAISSSVSSCEDRVKCEHWDLLITMEITTLQLSKVWEVVIRVIQFILTPALSCQPLSSDQHCRGHFIEILIMFQRFSFN